MFGAAYERPDLDNLSMKVPTLPKILSESPTQGIAQRGMTMVELMITLVVLAVLLGIAAPSFVRTMASNRMSTQTNEFIQGLKQARAEANRRGLSVAVQADEDLTPANFATGWTIFTNASGDGVLASTPTDAEGTRIRVNGRLAGNTVIHRVNRSTATDPPTYTASSAADRRYIVFTSRGNSAGGAAFFRICDSGASINGRIVQVSTVGNVTLDATDAACP
jgi:type IV fimbrial biogenesis protein FimT